MGNSNLKHHDLNKLSDYSSSHRKIEIISIVLFFILECQIIYWILKNFQISLLPYFLFAIVLGHISADFVSGFVHWAADTWGSVDWPIVGNSLIRPFREHHVDPKAITRHDVIETNGDNCMITLPLLLITSFYTYLFNANSKSYLIISFICSLSLFVLLTNQIHKWSHQDKVPVLISILQKMRIILHPIHHEIHHQAPFNKYYCITTGWLNYPLNKIHFFSTLENVIQKMTGAIPREDDIGKMAAQETTQRST